ncbi:hypothetical protein BGW36DRAFT_428300 [Talaromyces proteolyticus]|uniref:Uncharacterized protein n=1 Tax=Talaromyces proteolyticus TaxID=1131652 RepID=A0AAD4KMQ2_9EURO|nr:uncharacterized protein BGW36DRAFT_428300 [Talaromyces proteolyticus]KAH8696282.1 hypothetical protein BGW36DRAFT_428300 [Talaromyces proteolyticus]
MDTDISESLSSLSSPPEDLIDASDTPTGRRKPSSPRRANRNIRGKRHIKKARLDKVLQYMSSTGISIETFLRAYLECPDVLRSTTHRTQDKRHKRIRDALFSLLQGQSEQSNFLLQIISSLLRSEFDNLMETTYFGQFDSTTADPETIDFSELEGVLKEHAPTWNQIARILLSNDRMKHESYTGDKDKVAERQVKPLYLITSTFCFSRAKMRCNYLPKLMGYYLYSLGVNRRALGFLADIGICNHPQEIIKGAKMIARKEQGFHHGESP